MWKFMEFHIKKLLYIYFPYFWGFGGPQNPKTPDSVRAVHTPGLQIYEI